MDAHLSKIIIVRCLIGKFLKAIDSFQNIAHVPEEF